MINWQRTLLGRGLMQEYGPSISHGQRSLSRLSAYTVGARIAPAFDMGSKMKKWNREDVDFIQFCLWFLKGPACQKIHFLGL